MGEDWHIIHVSLKQAWWPILFIVSFETVLGREQSGKVSKKCLRTLISEESP